MTRKMTVEAEPLDKDHMLGLREQFATANHHGTKVEFDHGFGFGVTSLSVTVIFPGGRQVSETMQLQPMLQAWVEGVIDSNFIVRADADDTSTKEN